jgi:hypothetical protein
MKNRFAWLVLLCGMAIAVTTSATGQTPAPSPEASPAAPSSPAPEDIASPDGLPPMGKWMYDHVGVPAQWLGELIEGKKLREPINVIIVDPHARTPEDARDRLLAACQTAGYPARFGHSNGYQGYISEEFFKQLPQEKRTAFSNGPFELPNNHGRIFGPACVSDCYYFTGAFSRENVDPFTKVKHRYSSFNRARDAFSQRMNQRTKYKLTKHVSLNNDIVNDPVTTTGDHDGSAVLLNATE